MAYRSGTTKAREIQHQVIAGDFNNNDVTTTYNTLEYPVGGLGGSRYPHFTMFYFNELDKATVQSEYQQSNVPSRGVGVGKSTALKGDVKTTDMPTSDDLKNTVETLMNGDFSKSGRQIVDTAIKTAESAITNTISFISSGIKKYTPARKRLKLAIALPMPVKVRANYNAGYVATDEIGAMGATIFAAIQGGGEAAGKTALFSAIPAAAGAALQTVGGKVLGKDVNEALNSGFDSKGFQQLVSKLSGRVINKRQEQLFNNMDFRSHSFEYLFIPRSKEESDAVYEIIKQFKLAMHPTLEDGFGNSILITPAEFDIEFRYKADENQTVSRISTCALKSMDVNYTAIGEFVAFEGTDNPVAISLDMVFVEMEPLNRNQIQLGY